MWKTIRKSHNTIIKCSYFNQQGFIVKFHSQSGPSSSEKWLLKLIFLFPLRTHRSYFSDSVYTSECNHRKSHIKSAIRCLSKYGLAIKELIKRGELTRVSNKETNTVRATHDKSCGRFARRDCIPDVMRRRKFYATQSLASGNLSMLKLCSLATMLLSKGSSPCKFQIILILLFLLTFLLPLSPIFMRQWTHYWIQILFINSSSCFIRNPMRGIPREKQSCFSFFFTTNARFIN